MGLLSNVQTKIKLAQACTIAVHENLRSTGHSLVRFKVRPGAWMQYGLTLSSEMSPAMEVCDVGVAGELYEGGCQ